MLWGKISSTYTFYFSCLPPLSSVFRLPSSALSLSLSLFALFLAGCQVLRIWGMQDCNVLIKFALFPKVTWVREGGLAISPHTHIYSPHTCILAHEQFVFLQKDTGVRKAIVTETYCKAQLEASSMYYCVSRIHETLSLSCIVKPSIYNRQISPLRVNMIFHFFKLGLHD